MLRLSGNFHANSRKTEHPQGILKFDVPLGEEMAGMSIVKTAIVFLHRDKEFRGYLRDRI